MMLAMHVCILTYLSSVDGAVASIQFLRENRLSLEERQTGTQPGVQLHII